MSFIQSTLREGIVIGIEHTERLLTLLPIEEALRQIKAYREKIAQQIDDEKELKPEHSENL